MYIKKEIFITDAIQLCIAADTDYPATHQMTFLPNIALACRWEDGRSDRRRVRRVTLWCNNCSFWPSSWAPIMLKYITIEAYILIYEPCELKNKVINSKLSLILCFHFSFIISKGKAIQNNWYQMIVKGQIIIHSHSNVI